MAHPSESWAVAPMWVVGQNYCVPYNVDLAIVKKVMTITGGNFVVTDNSGNVMFRVKGKFLSIRGRRILSDSYGKPIVTLRQKIMSARGQWKAFRGESTDTSDLIFTARRSSMFQFRTKLDVFLPNNRNKHTCDFRVEGSWTERSCIIYAGDSSNRNIVAQMQKKISFKSVVLGKDKFMVTVYPNIDSAFIVALIVILAEFNDRD